MKTKSEFQFDFSLCINDKLICKRVFKCSNYTEDYITFDKAVEIITMTADTIREHIKSESIDLLWKKYDPFNQKTIFSKNPKIDLLTLTICSNSSPIASSCIDDYGFPPLVKYNIDIRSIISVIVNDIRHCLSE